MAERMDDTTAPRGASPYAGRAAGTGGTASHGTTADDPAAIRADIRQTRERLGDTLEEIGDRLNPRHLTEQVKDNIRDATIGRVEHMARSAADRVNETRYSLMDTIRDNPIPAAMVGLGLGWLMMNRRRHESHAVAEYQGAAAYRGTGAGLYGAEAARGGHAYAGAPYGAAEFDSTMAAGTADEHGRMERAREKAGHLGHDVKERAGHLRDDVRDRAGNVLHGAQDRAREVGDRAQRAASTVADRTRHQARRMEDRYYDQPLAMGAAAVALGLAAGMTVPVSDREVRLMGDARDKVVDRVREAASEARDKVETVVERVADEAKHTARDAAREEGLTSSR